MVWVSEYLLLYASLAVLYGFIPSYIHIEYTVYPVNGVALGFMRGVYGLSPCLAWTHLEVSAAQQRARQNSERELEYGDIEPL